MPIPKFSDLSPATQIVLILLVGAGVWALTEYTYPGLRRVRADNQTKRTTAERLTSEVTPLRPFRERVRALEVDNKQLEIQLANLQRIVPNEKEVDNFVRLLQSEAANAGIALRRITAAAPVSQQYHVEVPFQMELDGSYFDVLQFYDRLGRVERITNVSDLKMGGIQSGRAGAGGKYDYSANETVVAVCKVTTFFSREEEAAPAQPAPGRAPARGTPTVPGRPPAPGAAR